MKLFIKNFLVFISLILLLDWGLGEVLKKFYFSQKSGQQYRINNSLNKTKADLLIIGSSRASDNYVSTIFEKKLNISCYNCGINGSGIISHTALLKAALKRHIPKIIILDFNKNELIKDTYSYDRLSNLLPYYSSHEEIRSAIELRSKFEKLKLYSKTYPYNSLILQILYGNTDISKKFDDKDIKGYLPLSGKWEYPISRDTNTINGIIDQNKKQAFSQFVKICTEFKIKLYIFTAPYYAISEGDGISIKSMTKYIKNKNIYYENYYQNSLFLKNRNLFHDVEHLNQNGAKQYSNFISDFILKTEKSKKNVKKNNHHTK